MRNRLRKIIFGGIVALTTVTLVAFANLVSINQPLVTQKSASLSSIKQENAKNVQTKNSVNHLLHNGDPSSPDLSIVHRGNDWIVSGLTERGQRQSSISIPVGVTQIGAKAFQNDTILTSVDIPAGVTLIASHAFAGCTNLSEAVLPNSLQVLGTNAFAGCVSLRLVNIPKAIFDIVEAFKNTDLSDISLHEVRSLSNHTFQNSKDDVLCLNFMEDNIYFEKDAILPPEDQLHTINNFLVAWATNQTVVDKLQNDTYFLAKNVHRLSNSADVYYRSTDYYMVGLTKEGQKASEIVIPSEVKVVSNFTFSECSDELKKIVVKGQDVKFAKHALFAVPNNVDYYVTDLVTANNLAAIGVPKNQIICTGSKFEITLNGIIQSVKQKAVVDNSVVIPKKTDTGILVSGIGSKAFVNCPNVTRVVFASDSEVNKISDQAFIDLDPTNTYYYVNKQNQKLIEQLLNAKIDQDHIVYSNPEFNVTKSGILHRVVENPEVKSVTIPTAIGDREINEIGSNAFSECKWVTTIIFPADCKIAKIDQQAFVGLNEDQTYYYVDEHAVDTISSLNDVINNKDHIIVQGTNFGITTAGTISHLDLSGPSLYVEEKYGGCHVTGIGSNAFDRCQNVRSIEFADGIKFTGAIAADAFGGLNRPILYVYSNYNATALAGVAKNFEIGVSNHDRDLFVDFSNSSKFDGLTTLGREQNKLVVPKTIAYIGSNAFSNCSSNLNEITLKSNQLEIDPGTFKVPSLKGILAKIHFNVSNKKVKNMLWSRGINISSISICNFPDPSPHKTKLKPQTGIIIGITVVLSVMILGLGVGLPLLMQNKITKLRLKVRAYANKRLPPKISWRSRQETKSLPADRPKLNSPTLPQSQSVNFRSSPPESRTG